MRYLVLMRGTPASGKSTFLKEHNLEKYTLCPDNIRLLYSSPILKNGQFGISQKNDKIVWDNLFTALEFRMRNGDFTIIDATHSSNKSINAYKKLCVKYRYRCIVLDMNDLFDLETKIEFDKKRGYKQVGENVIRKIDDRIRNNEDMPSFVTVIKNPTYEKLMEQLTIRPIELDKNKKVYIISKIYGSDTALSYAEKYAENENNIVVFLGRYFSTINTDNENGDALQRLSKLAIMKNVILLEDYADTKLRLKNQNEENCYGLNRKQLSNFLNRLRQVVVFKSNETGNEVLVTSSGVDYEIEQGVDIKQELFKISFLDMSNHCILQYTKNTGYTQVYDTGRYNGTIRITTLECGLMDYISIEDNRKKRIISNSVRTVGSYRNKQHFENTTLIEKLRLNHRDIKEKKFENISSFNFKRDVFHKKKWNDMTIKARGLFMNEDGTIAARAYDKFFNLNEREETERKNLKETLIFPVAMYEKYNGFLGLLSYDKYKDDLLFCSKSSIGTEYAEDFKRIFYNTVSKEDAENIKECVREGCATFVFEVISPNKDPHIIQEDRERIVLLDVIDNKEELSKCDYPTLRKAQYAFGLEVKKRIRVFFNAEELFSEIDRRKAEEEIEGYVIEDNTGFQFKVKTAYYLFWNRMRDILVKMQNRKNVDESRLDVLQLCYYRKMKDIPNLDKMSIIDIQKALPHIITGGY